MLRYIKNYIITFRYVKLWAYISTIYLLNKIYEQQKEKQSSNTIKKIIYLIPFVKKIISMLPQESKTEQTRLYKKHAMYSGFQFIYGLLNKGLLLIATGLLLGILPQLLLTTLFFSLLKIFSGGLHFDIYVKCTYFSLLMFSFVAYLSKHIYINTSLTIIIFASVFVLFILVAPIENKNWPLKNKEKARFKYLSLTVLLILFITNILVDNKLIDNSITYGVLLSGIIASPLVNKIKK